MSQLLIQIILEDWKKSDFIEMTLHHLVTVYLYGFSFMSNMMIGGPVAFLHNWADMMNSWTRIWAETVHSKVAGYSFLIAQITWFYTRIYVFPQLIYVSTIKLEINVVSPYIIQIFGLLLWCLYALHIYWFILMQVMLFNFFKKGVAEDTVNKNKSTVPDGGVELKKKQ
jgi:ceramide synthetase